MRAVNAAEATAVPTETPTQARPTPHGPCANASTRERDAAERDAGNRPRTPAAEAAAGAVGQATCDRARDDARHTAHGEHEARRDRHP